MTSDFNNASPSSRPPGRLEREESQLWRWTLLFMVLLAVALAALMWERLDGIPFHLRAIPIGVLALSVLFAFYAYGRRREVGELQEALRGLQEHVGAAPSEEQLDQLSQVIMRSQRNFKELIDSFDEDRESPLEKMVRWFFLLLAYNPRNPGLHLPEHVLIRRELEQEAALRSGYVLMPLKVLNGSQVVALLWSYYQDERVESLVEDLRRAYSEAAR